MSFGAINTIPYTHESYYIPLDIGFSLYSLAFALRLRSSSLFSAETRGSEEVEDPRTILAEKSRSRSVTRPGVGRFSLAGPRDWTPQSQKTRNESPSDKPVPLSISPINFSRVVGDQSRLALESSGHSGISLDFDRSHRIESNDHSDSSKFFNRAYESSDSKPQSRFSRWRRPMSGLVGLDDDEEDEEVYDSLRGSSGIEMSPANTSLLSKSRQVLNFYMSYHYVLHSHNQTLYSLLVSTVRSMSYCKLCFALLSLTRQDTTVL